MVEVESRDFCIDQIANSGQCFRISELSPGIWEVIAYGKQLIIKKKHQKNPIYELTHIFECSQEEYDLIWKNYFDMPRDYSKIKEEIRALDDPYLTNAVNFGYGIRILRQDFWETLITFIISQRNSIKRIKKIIKNLCAPYNLRFPSANELSLYSEGDLMDLGLGYRARYIKNAAIAVLKGDFDFIKLQKMPYEEAIRHLKTIDGVGNKVANCVILFGLHKLEAFPVDVWIKKILDREYGGRLFFEDSNFQKASKKTKNSIKSFDCNRFPGYAGVVQQYMFYYERYRSL